MTENADKDETKEARLRRLKRYNPFVVGLDDREGYKRLHLQLFDGESSLVAEPLADFDGYRSERDYPYFAPAFILTGTACLLPLLPLVLRAKFFLYAGVTVLFVCACIYLSVRVAFHLTNMRMDYSNANSNILAANFVNRARGIRNIIHTFKRTLRWRRFMRYAMYFGYFGLLLSFLTAVILMVERQPSGEMILASIMQFVVSLLALSIFEIGRKNYTRGVDPTLALVLMVEEIGGQLLASRQTRLINSAN
jgi:hypothetical protein